MRTWSAHHLVEFLASVTEEDDETRAIRRAVELCSESIGAEVGAAIVGGTLRCAVGFGTTSVPTRLLEELPPGIWHGELGELGPACAAVCHMLRREDRLIVARLDDELGPEERNLLEGMARVTGLVLRTLRTLSSERELRSAQQQLADERLRSVQSLQSRQQLLETLLELQQAISHRAPLEQILSTATSGAARLLERSVWLYLDTSAMPGASQRALGSFQLYGPHGAGRPGALRAARAEVLAARRPQAREAPAPTANPFQAGYIVSTVHVGGVITGALAAEADPDKGFDRHDQRLLITLAEQVSMALTDVRTLAAVDEASHDPLTGLPNRALFLRSVESALAKGQDDSVAVLFVDLDRFKAVNDTLGHTAGDELLKMVAARLAGCLREGAVVARLGGDEFAVLLERVRYPREAEVLAERVIDRLREPFSLQRSTVVIGASIGIALAGAAVDAQELIRDADLAMYRAKKDGGQGWALFEPQMYLAVKERLELEADLESAVGLGQLGLDYEPIVRLRDDTVVAARANLYWEHPVRGRIPPEVFVPLAEETGAIVEIGRWILQRALDDLASWRVRGHDVGMSLRLSPRQLHDPLFADQVASALAQRSCPPSRLALSLSEPTLRAEPASLLEERAGEIVEVGIALGVDSFAGGISSLALLESLPISALRIDPRLVEGLGRAGGVGTLARGAVELASALGLRAIAVGVTSADQLEELRAVSCQFGEGPYFSARLDAEAMAHLLDARGATSTRSSRAPAAARG
jgi:diguanylate cyclase (GGDEF)-like protein